MKKRLNTKKTYTQFKSDQDNSKLNAVNHPPNTTCVREYSLMGKIFHFTLGIGLSLFFALLLGGTLTYWTAQLPISLFLPLIIGFTTTTAFLVFQIKRLCQLDRRIPLHAHKLCDDSHEKRFPQNLNPNDPASPNYIDQTALYLEDIHRQDDIRRMSDYHNENR